MMKKLLFVFLALLFILNVNSGCGENNNNPIKNHGMNNSKEKIIENFTYNGEKRRLTVLGVPKKAVVCGNSAADTLLALGAESCVDTIVLTEPIDPEKYKNLFPKAKIEVRPPSKEALLSLKPDFIVGPRRFFSDKVMGSPAFWDSRKVAAYIQEGSGPIPTLANFPPCTIESEKQFIRNMGIIFNKEDIAEKYINGIDEELKKGKTKLTRPRVLAVEFMARQIECFGKVLLIGNIVENLNGEIISFEHPFISKEDLFFIDADIVFVIYHGGKAEEEIALKNAKESPLNRLPAVREGRLYSVYYPDIVGPAINLVDTIKYVRSKMYHR